MWVVPERTQVIGLVSKVPLPAESSCQTQIFILMDFFSKCLRYLTTVWRLLIYLTYIEKPKNNIIRKPLCCLVAHDVCVLLKILQ